MDALFDGAELYLGGVMEHIEEAGIHSGDSACALPPITLGVNEIDRIRRSTLALAQGVGVRGLLNVQYALVGDSLYVLEANPRASRTVPFVSKATAVPLAKAAARVALGATIAELRAEGLLPATGDGGDLPDTAPIAVKEAVLPFHRFRTPGGDQVDSILGPEMKSTGEVMGFDASFGTAFAKSQAASYGSLPVGGTVFVSIANRDKRAAIFPVKRLSDLGFRVMATAGTAQVLRRNGVEVEVVGKFSDGPGNVVERIAAGDVDLVLNTPWGSGGPRLDGYEIRTAAVAAGIPCLTTTQGFAAAVQGIEQLIRGEIGVRSLQSLHAALGAARQADGGAVAGTGVGVTRASPGPGTGRDLLGHPGGRLLPVHRRRAGHRRRLRARALRGRGGRRREHGHGAAPGLRDRRRHPGRRVRRARCSSWWPSTAPAPAGWCSGRRATCSTSSARSALRSRSRPARRRRCWSAAATAPRRCCRWRSGCWTTARRWSSCSARPRPGGCTASSPRSGWPGRSPSPPTTARRGSRGLVTDALPAAIERIGAEVVYACGPMPMLQAVGAVAQRHAIRAQVAVEEAMACGIGVCMTCVLPVRGDDGQTRLVRSCVEGPVFDAGRVRWNDVGHLPADLVGADAMRGH